LQSPKHHVGSSQGNFCASPVEIGAGKMSSTVLFIRQRLSSRFEIDGAHLKVGRPATRARKMTDILRGFAR
jgi:hypothetical protein